LAPNLYCHSRGFKEYCASVAGELLKNAAYPIGQAAPSGAGAMEKRFVVRRLVVCGPTTP